jgi:hypothetical protein
MCSTTVAAKQQKVVHRAEFASPRADMTGFTA